MADISASAASLAGRYALALFELAREQGALDAVASDLEALRSLLRGSEDLRRLISNPILSRDEQARSMDAVAARGGAHDLTRRFLGVLADRRRLFALPDMIRTFEEVHAEHRGEITAELVSAVDLTEEQVATLRKQVAAAAGQAVNLSTRVDPALIGGIVLRIGSRMIDASLRNKLHQLELAMRGAA